MFYLVRLTWRDGDGNETTKYFPTASKNLAGSTLVLKETSAGASLSYDSTVIAGDEWVNGIPQSLNGIGEFEQAVDLAIGGGVAQMSDGFITLVNPQYSGSDRFDTTVLAAPTYLENATVKIYMGFIPAGATPTVVIADDMLLRWSGVVEDAHDFDHKTVRLACVDGSELRHKEIPEDTVTINDYPRCPKENLGRVIPLLYGDYSSGGEFSGFDNTEDVKWTLADLCPAPGISVDYFTMKHVFAAHECHTFSQRTFQYDAAIDAYGGLYNPGFVFDPGSRDTYDFTRANTSAGCFITYRPNGIGAPITEWRQPVRFRNSQTSATYADTQFINTIDRDATTKAQIFPTDIYSYNCDPPAGAGRYCTVHGYYIRLNPVDVAPTLYLRGVFERNNIFAVGTVNLFWDENDGTGLSDTDVSIAKGDLVAFPFTKEVQLTHGGKSPIMDSGYVSENRFGMLDSSIGTIGGTAHFYGMAVVYFAIPTFRYALSVRIPTIGVRIARR
jgi:hypothetical protein